MSTINNTKIIDLTPENIAEYGVCGYKDIDKHEGLRRKIDWFKNNYPKGLRIKIIFCSKGGNQGMIEYIPGKYAYRPVSAQKYLFIHCIFVGFKKEFKNKGFASLLIDECINVAKSLGFKGVAVVTRSGSFMIGKEIFVKKDFKVVDKAEPDFELLVKKFDKYAEDPKFVLNMKENLKKYSKGLTIFRSAQCPYSVNNINAIIETARKKFKVEPNLIDLENSDAAQNTPCAFGTFCIIFNGEIISYHPISNTRFENIMKNKFK
jgi:hypothetical protein